MYAQALPYGAMYDTSCCFMWMELAWLNTLRKPYKQGSPASHMHANTFDLPSAWKNNIMTQDVPYVPNKEKK